MTRRRVLPLAVAALALPAALGAQVTVAGTVGDSLLGQPLAGATVQLVPAARPWTTPRSAMVDATGRFRVDSVVPGVYLVGFAHPRLDELGVQLPPRRLEVNGKKGTLQVDLALPSAEAFTAAVCGARRDSSGLLLGRVLDADTRRPVTTGSVTLSWAELVIERDRGARRERRVLRAPVDEGGRFAACGVPAGSPVAVQAASGAASSGVVELELPPRSPLVRELTLARGDTARAPGAPRGGTARVAGRVLRADRQPVEGAQVLLRGSGAADTVVTTGATGAFALGGLPAGTWTVEARAIGYLPRRAPVDLASGATTEAELVFDQRIATLPVVRVAARAQPSDPTGFLARSRKRAFGHFIGEDRIEKTGARSIAVLLGTVPGVRIATGFGGRTVVRLRGCAPNVYLDRVLLTDGASTIDALVDPRELGGIEVYPDNTTTPIEFQRGSCGSIVVWTRGAVHPGER